MNMKNIDKKAKIKLIMERIKENINVGLIATLITCTIFLILLVQYSFDYLDNSQKYAVLAAVGMFLGIVTMLLVMLFCNIINTYKKSEYGKYLLDKLESSSSDEKDIIALMLKNNEETIEYFHISKNHAKSSFDLSIIACLVGIAMIGISLYGVFKMKDTQFAIIGIVGGAITELIAGTVLVIHNKSALQLNYYYDALHENEKFLSAINLADKLDDDTQRDMYIEIIRAQIQSAKDYKKEEQNSGKNSD